MVSLAQDSKVQATSSHTYTANFPSHWCIGTVPHGGFVTATFQRVAALHFSTTLQKQDQPHTMTMHLSFLRRTEVGPAAFKVVDAKVGRGTSTIHVTLSQNGREEAVAYITNINLKTESGVSLPTSWSLHPEPTPPPASFAALKAGNDARWAEKDTPFPEFRRAARNVRLFYPRAGQPHPSVADQWMTFTSGEKFTNDQLGFVVDIFPQLIESYRPPSDLAAFWYPTVLLNLEVKKLLPEEGVEWLFMRTRAKAIKGGRYDLDICVLDQEGELVATSNHVVMIVDAARNLAQRSKGASDGTKL